MNIPKSLVSNNKENWTKKYIEWEQNKRLCCTPYNCCKCNNKCHKNRINNHWNRFGWALKRPWRQKWFRRSCNNRWRRPWVRTHHLDNESLAILAVIMNSTDEVDRPWPVKLDNTLAIVEGDDGPACIAMVKTPFVHFKDWIIVVLKNYTERNKTHHRKSEDSSSSKNYKKT